MRGRKREKKEWRETAIRWINNRMECYLSLCAATTTNIDPIRLLWQFKVENWLSFKWVLNELHCLIKYTYIREVWELKQLKLGEYVKQGVFVSISPRKANKYLVFIWYILEFYCKLCRVDCETSVNTINTFFIKRIRRAQTRNGGMWIVRGGVKRGGGCEEGGRWVERQLTWHLFYNESEKEMTWGL